MYNIAQEILKLLEKNHFESYIIGGYPRNKYLNIKSQDIDICTSAKYKELKKIFPKIKKNNYGSYIIFYKNQQYEITTFRKEGKYKNNRFPQKIRYTKKIKKDLKRRDFIINTLCIDKTGNYVDLKNAKKDLDNKIIRLVGNKKSLEKDALRILRTIRFATTLDFKLDKKLEQAINKYKHLLTNISYDRKKKELDKIFEDKNILYGIELIKKFELEKYLSINVDKIVPTKNIGIWAQIIIDNSYPFTKEEKKQIKIIRELIQKEFELYDLYQYGEDYFQIVNEIKKTKQNIKKMYKELPIKDRSEIEINFFEISETIYTTNNNINSIYIDIEKQIIYKNIKNKKQDIKKYLKNKYTK